MRREASFFPTPLILISTHAPLLQRGCTSDAGADVATSTTPHVLPIFSSKSSIIFPPPPPPLFVCSSSS